MAFAQEDPFDFNNDDYVESQVPDFNSSFMEQFRAGSSDSDEEEVIGFRQEEVEKENVDPERRPAKKRKADPSRWKRNIHKNALARGLPMVDSLGRVKPGRKTGPPCKCNRECFAVVNKVERRWILDNFNAIGDWSLQNVYLRGLIIAEPQMEGRPFKTFSYFAQTSQLSRTQVCAKAFISLYGITKARVRTIRSKVCPIDRRGRHHNRPFRVSEENKNKVRVHIESFPRQRSANSNKEYIEGDWSVQRMYYNYLEQQEPAVFERNREIIRCKKENRSPVPSKLKPIISLHMYREIFNLEYNLGFARLCGSTHR